MKANKDYITGTVRTRKVGSDCVFEICSREEWESLNEEQRDALLLEAMWDSGIVDVFSNE